MLAALAFPASAERRLAVVELSTPPTMIGLGAQLTQAILQEAQRQGGRVIEPDAVRDVIGAKAYDELLQCEGAPACVARHVMPTGVTRVVAGSLNRDEKSYLLKLALVDVGTGKVIASVDRAILIASRRFLQDATAPIPALLRGEREATGTLKLSSAVKHVNATVDGREVGQLPATVELKPGKHEVTASKRGYLAVTKLVTVEAGRTSEESLRMILGPGQIDPDEAPLQVAVHKERPPQPPPPAARPLAQPDIPVPTEPVQRLSPAVWIAEGTGLAALTTGVVLGSLSHSIERKLKDGYDPVTNTYAGTRAEALTGKAEALWANVAFGVGVAAVLTGGTMAMIDAHRVSQVHLVPTLDAHGGGVTLSGSFP